MWVVEATDDVHRNDWFWRTYCPLRSYSTVNNVSDIFSLAVQYHQAGNLRQAEPLYRQVLQAAPQHPDALHLLGVVAYQTGRPDEAITLIGQALALKQWDAGYYSNYGLALQAKGRIDEALASFRQALQLQPDFVDAHSNIGDTLRVAGKLPEAIMHCREALRYRPDHPQAHGNLGNALMAQGKIDEAIACFRRALQINPNMPVVHNSLGNALEQQSRHEEAIHSYQQAIRLDPRYAESYNNMSIVYKFQNKFEDAIRACQTAIQLNPRYAEAYNNLGAVLRRADRLDEAVQCYQQALRIKPDLSDACSNLGNVCRAQGKFEEALAWYDKALGQDKSHVEGRLNRALLRLLLGQWAEAWPDYESRLQTKAFPKFTGRQPRWDGSPLAGRTLLLLGEQGLGDTLQFVRYAALIQQTGGQVIVQCQAPLQKLLAGCPGVSKVVAMDSPLPEFDVYAPLMSLPGILGTTPATIPGDGPYLHAEPALVEQWRNELSTNIQPDTLKIGIAWQGSPSFTDDRQRSIPLTQFGLLAQIPKVSLISLQKGPGTEQLRVLAGQIAVLDVENRLGNASESFPRLAALMKNVDLVISCDTAVAHLAAPWACQPGWHCRWCRTGAGY